MLANEVEHSQPVGLNDDGSVKYHLRLVMVGPTTLVECPGCYALVIQDALDRHCNQEHNMTCGPVINA
jgi:hypothetical protein